MIQEYVTASPKPFREALKDLLFEGKGYYFHFHILSYREKKGEKTLRFLLRVGVPDDPDIEPHERGELLLEECTYSVSQRLEKKRGKGSRKPSEEGAEVTADGVEGLTEKLVTPYSLPVSFGPEEVDLGPLILEAAATTCKLFALEESESFKVSVLVPEVDAQEWFDGSEDLDESDESEPEGEEDSSGEDASSQGALITAETEEVAESLTKKVLESLKKNKKPR